MKLRSTSLLVGILIVALAGCAKAPRGSRVVTDVSELPTIQQQKAKELADVKIGMSLADFRDLMPDATLAAQDGSVTAYEISSTQRYVTQADIKRQNIIWGSGSPSPRATKQVLWFYFREGQLVKWGPPRDWPGGPQ